MSYSNRLFNLLSVGQDAKTVKGEKLGYLTGILYLAPANQSGVINLCPHASPGCKAACLFSAGMGKFKNVINARIKRTLLFKSNRQEFLRQLKADLHVLKAVAMSRGMLHVARLDGTSDVGWHQYGLCEEFPDTPFYGYTKDFQRMKKFLAGKFPANYHLTFSRSETNGEQVKEIIALGGNVAVVFAGKTLPETYLGRRVVNGDESDLRFLDGEGVIVGLTAKGKAKKEDSGFVVDMAKEGI